MGMHAFETSPLPWATIREPLLTPRTYSVRPGVAQDRRIERVRPAAGPGPPGRGGRGGVAHRDLRVVNAIVEHACGGKHGIYR